MKKSKVSTFELICSLIAIALGVLMIIPMFVSSIESTLLGRVVESYTIFTLGDMVATLSEEVASIATATEVIALIAIICALVMAVLELLKLIGIKFPRFLRMLASIATVVISILAFIMFIVLVSKANPSSEITNVASYAMSAGAILILVFGVVGGTAGVLANRK